MYEVPPTPDIKWYLTRSNDKGFDDPRCRFASAGKCPRYYQSLSLLGASGATAIDQSEDKKLLKRWKHHHLWPKTKEQETSIMGLPGNPTIYSRFCPEVSYDAFGIFASTMCRYANDEDTEIAHQQLARRGIPVSDWRWNWSQITPVHYSECPLYSPLSHERLDTRVDRLLSWGKDNPIIAILVVVSIVTGSIATFATDLSGLIARFKREPVIVLASRLTSEDVSGGGTKMSMTSLVQFKPKDPRQVIQQMIVAFPEDIADRKIEVAPPFKADIGSSVAGINLYFLQKIADKGASGQPETPGQHHWISRGSLPVVIDVDFLTASGKPQTDRLLYDLDFFYSVWVDCEQLCQDERWSVNTINIRYVRTLQARGDSKSAADAEMSHRHFSLQDGH